MKFRKEIVIPAVILGGIGILSIENASEDVKPGKAYVKKLAEETDAAATGGFFSKSGLDERKFRSLSAKAIDAAATRMVDAMGEDITSKHRNWAEALAYCAIAGANGNLGDEKGPARQYVYEAFDAEGNADAFSFSDNSVPLPEDLANNCRQIDIELAQKDDIYLLPGNPQS